MKHFITAAAVLAGSLFAHAAPEDAVIRVNSTKQKYLPAQPWEKSSPTQRRGLATILQDHKILTTAEMVANSAYIELETPEGDKKMPAKIIAIDYEANLALLEPSTKEGKAALKKFDTVEMATPQKLNSKVKVLQLEDNGQSIVTDGKIQGVDVVSSFVSGNYFLTYEIKASMQSATSSYTIPVFSDNKMLGLLTSYNSEDQLIDCIAPEIISAFLKDAADGKYEGFPSLGLSTSRTTDPNLRAWLKLKPEHGGLYISGIKRNSAASKADLKKGDVLLAIDGYAVNERGYFESKSYGKLHWSHLTRAVKRTGENVELTILRDGKEQKRTVKLERRAEGLIPAHMHDKAPNYLVKGGLIFQELTGSYLEAFGKEWRTRAPLSLLDVYTHPKDYEKGRNRLVFLSAVIRTPASVSYELLRNTVINKVNDQPVADIKSLMEAFKKPTDGLHKIELDGTPKTIYLDATTSDEVDKILKQRGLPNLSRVK